MELSLVIFAGRQRLVIWVGVVSLLLSFSSCMGFGQVSDLCLGQSLGVSVGRRHISVSAVPLGPGIDIWRTCRFLGSLLGALGALPGGYERFFSLSDWCEPLSPKAHWVGEEWPWTPCSSGPRETSSVLLQFYCFLLGFETQATWLRAVQGTSPARLWFEKITAHSRDRRGGPSF